MRKLRVQQVAEIRGMRLVNKNYFMSPLFWELRQDYVARPRHSPFTVLGGRFALLSAIAPALKACSGVEGIGMGLL